VLLLLPCLLLFFLRDDFEERGVPTVLSFAGFLMAIEMVLLLRTMSMRTSGPSPFLRRCLLTDNTRSPTSNVVSLNNPFSEMLDTVISPDLESCCSLIPALSFRSSLRTVMQDKPPNEELDFWECNDRVVSFISEGFARDAGCFV